MVAINLQKGCFLAFVVLYACAPLHAAPARSIGSRAKEKRHMTAVDQLPAEQRKIYEGLTPMYQRVYVYAFDEKTRERVTLFVNRGYNPYQMIDMVLKYDKKKATELGKWSDAQEPRRRSPLEQRYEPKSPKLLM